LANSSAWLRGFVQSVRGIPHLVVIDGCEVGCAKVLLEQAEVPLRSYMVITELGIGKNKEVNLKREVKNLPRELPIFRPSLQFSRTRG